MNRRCWTSYREASGEDDESTKSSPISPSTTAVHPPSTSTKSVTPIQPGLHTDAPAANLEWSANILSIKVLDSTVGYPISLYGSVFVRDDLDRKRVYLFRRDRDNAQVIKTPVIYVQFVSHLQLFRLNTKLVGNMSSSKDRYSYEDLDQFTQEEDTLVLTGPSRGLVLLDNLFFKFNLKMRGDQEADDMEFSQGRMEYDNRVVYKSMLIRDKLTTKLSTMGMTYALVNRAVEATIQIKVPEEFSIELDKFYGKISAFITGTVTEVILFNSEACGTVIKIGDDGIKLWRHVLSVPIDGSLVLRVDTWEGDCKAKLRRSSTIFTPQICGKDVASVHGPMQIKVTWSPSYICEYDDKLRLNVICDDI
ncbi:hypothetical protein EJB05_18961, partial [Eragrostis curvula]